MTEQNETIADHWRRVAQGLGMTEEHIQAGLVELELAERRYSERVAESLPHRTQQHPTIARLERQAKQYAHAASTATTQSARNMLSMQGSFITVIAKLGQQPEEWDTMAEQMIEVNVEMLADVIAAGVAKLPPAVHVPDIVDAPVVDSE